MITTSQPPSTELAADPAAAGVDCAPEALVVLWSSDPEPDHGKTRNVKVKGATVLRGHDLQAWLSDRRERLDTVARSTLWNCLVSIAE